MIEDAVAVRAIALMAVMQAVGCSEGAERRAAPSPLVGTIYFISERGDQELALRAVRAGDGRERDILTDGAKYFPYGQSRDGRRLAVVRSAQGADNIILIDPLGREVTELAPADAFNWYPKFSPDGRWVLFESSRASFRDLYKLELATGRLVRLTDNVEGNFDADWSPDGRSIAFASSRHGQLDLFVMDADGNNQKRLTRHPGDSIKPSWSADGTLIAFISGRDDRDDLFVIRPDGTGLAKLTEDMAPDGLVESFEWSPRERVIAYAVRRPAVGSRIFTVEVDRKRSSAFSREEQDNHAHPVWSPDGQHLAFTSYADGGSSIWTARRDGSNRARLTHGPHAAWRPRWLNPVERSTW